MNTAPAGSSPSAPDTALTSDLFIPRSQGPSPFLPMYFGALAAALPAAVANVRLELQSRAPQRAAATLSLVEKQPRDGRMGTEGAFDQWRWRQLPQQSF